VLAGQPAWQISEMLRLGGEDGGRKVLRFSPGARRTPLAEGEAVQALTAPVAENANPSRSSMRSAWRGSARRNCHDPLMSVSRLMPIRCFAWRTLPSGRSRATALLMTGKARYVLQSCPVPILVVVDRAITTQSD
jgi:hypothetical protein